MALLMFIGVRPKISRTFTYMPSVSECIKEKALCDVMLFIYVRNSKGRTISLNLFKSSKAELSEENKRFHRKIILWLILLMSEKLKELHEVLATELLKRVKDPDCKVC